MKSIEPMSVPAGKNPRSRICQPIPPQLASPRSHRRHPAQSDIHETRNKEPFMRSPKTTTAEKPRTRRELIRQSGGALAAAALSEMAVPLVHAGGNNTIRLALVGCGGRGTGAVGDAFSTTGGPVQLYAMADLFDDRLGASLKTAQHHVQGEGRRDLGAELPGVRRLQEGDRLPVSRGRGLAHDPCGVSADDVRVCREERGERLHGEVVRDRRPQHAPAARRGPGVGTEEPQGRCRLHVAPFPGAGRGHPANPRRGDRRSPHPADLPGARPDDLPQATAGRERAGLPDQACLQLQLAVLRVPDRLALPQHRCRMLGEGSLARLGPGHGRAMQSAKWATSSTTTPWNSPSPTAPSCSRSPGT